MRVVLAAVLLVLAPAALGAQQKPPPQPGAPATATRTEPATTADHVVCAHLHDAGRDDHQRRAAGACGRLRKVIAYLQEALAASTNATVRAQAQGWRVLKASETGPNGAVLYVFLFDPAVQGADYGLGRILAEAFPDQTKLQEIWKLYTDSLAGGGSLLSLTPVQPSSPAAAAPTAPPQP